MGTREVEYYLGDQTEFLSRFAFFRRALLHEKFTQNKKKEEGEEAGRRRYSTMWLTRMRLFLFVLIGERKLSVDQLEIFSFCIS